MNVPLRDRALRWALIAMSVLLGGRVALAAETPSQPQVVQVPSLDAPGGQPVLLPGYWWPAGGAQVSNVAVTTGRQPAVVMLHGCGGLYTPRAAQTGPAALTSRYTEQAQRLNAMGIHVLAVDSLSPRHERELCTQALGRRKVTQRHRRLDALGSLAWLADRAAGDVDPARLGLLGWSNGGSTVLAATNGLRPEVAAAPVRASLAVAYYPGCETDLASGYRVTAPLLLLVGQEDDWTPAEPCRQLQAQSRRPGQTQTDIELEIFAGAYHGFDGNGPVRLRRDVPNGVSPGQGVHVGGHAPSREAARRRLEAFLQQHWRLL